jgi:hypothetical protein
MRGESSQASPISQVQAHLQHSSERNRHQSSLLRLPGELRNKIYRYAMSGVTLSIFPSPNSRERFHLHAHLAGATTVAVPSSKVLDMTSLTRVCRQVYVETLLLPFQAITFHIHSDGSFLKFIDVLSDAERDAISTVQLSSPDANAGGTLCYSIANSIGNDEDSQRNLLDFLEWSLNLGLDRLGGLKQVVVEADKQWVYKKSGERFLRQGIASCVKGRDVAIVIPESSDLN